ncbi:uncharacterized protein [Halyomorpha halys]|uniref:uncharacterized protein n=1 Tax=Halyomorpha halys TaxID=286706 RepID=UPI0034D35C0E
MVNNIKCGPIRRANLIKDDHGNILMFEGDVQERWREYFKSLLNPREAENCLEDRVQSPVGINDEDLEAIPPDVEDIEDILSKLKKNKSPGNDGLPAELFKGGHHEVHRELQDLIAQIWEEETIP